MDSGYAWLWRHDREVMHMQVASQLFSPLTFSTICKWLLWFFIFVQQFSHLCSYQAQLQRQVRWQDQRNMGED